MPTDNPANVCQPYSIPLKVFSTVQALENPKEFSGVFHIKSHSVIPNKNRYHPLAWDLTNVYLRLGTRPGVL